MSGFGGAWFFGILAPTSSVVPGLTQTIVEHRMYLSLAAVLTLAVVAAYTWVGTKAILVCGAVVVAFVALTIRRNEDYRSELAIWRDTAAKRPHNALAQYNLGSTLVRIGKPTEAIDAYARALEAKPDYAEAHNNLGNVLSGLNRLDDALAHYEAARRAKPDYLEAENNLGLTLIALGRPTEAVPSCERAVQKNPSNAEAHTTLGNAYFQVGRATDAIAQYRASIAAQPTYPDAYYNLANAVLASAPVAEA